MVLGLGLGLGLGLRLELGLGLRLGLEYTHLVVDGGAQQGREVRRDQVEGCQQQRCGQRAAAQMHAAEQLATWPRGVLQPYVVEAATISDGG